LVMNYRLYFGKKIKADFQQDGTICFRSFDWWWKKDQNFKAVATYSVVAEFTNEAGKIIQSQTA
jgi:hypothetical protein